MALTQAQKRQLVEDALRDHFPWSGRGNDTRRLRELRKEFEHRHLAGLVASYRKQQAAQFLESFDIADIDAP